MKVLIAETLQQTWKVEDSEEIEDLSPDTQCREPALSYVNRA